MMSDMYPAIKQAAPDYDRSEYVYLQLDNLEYALERYRDGLASAYTTSRAVMTFAVHCQTQEFRQRVVRQVAVASYSPVTVDVVDISFKPATVTVKVGQTVEWRQRDSTDDEQTVPGLGGHRHHGLQRAAEQKAHGQPRPGPDEGAGGVEQHEPVPGDPHDAGQRRSQRATAGDVPGLRLGR